VSSFSVVFEMICSLFLGVQEPEKSNVGLLIVISNPKAHAMNANGMAIAKRPMQVSLIPASLIAELNCT
jgi:hypothetical protein